MKSSLFQKRSIAILCSILCALLWGAGFPVIKLGYSYVGIDSSNPFGTILFAGIRFFFAGLITLPLSKPWKGESLQKTPRLAFSILLLALVQTVLQYLFQYVGICNTTGSSSSIIGQSNVFLLCFLSPLFFKDDTLTLKKIVGCTIGFLGIIAVNVSADMQFVFAPNGELLVLFASIAACGGFLMSKKISARQNAAAVSSLQQIIGGAILMTIGFLGGGRFTEFKPLAIPVLLFLILSAAVANTLWTVLLKHNPISHISVYKFATPMFGMIFSAILLREDILMWNKLLSVLAVSMGIFIVNTSHPKKELKNDLSQL